MGLKGYECYSVYVLLHQSATVSTWMIWKGRNIYMQLDNPDTFFLPAKSTSRRLGNQTSSTSKYYERKYKTTKIRGLSD